ncbi:unnamed protein product [Paramecium sonneborni]|uniref:Uncharacterized protein n=1 Tax=Paramecium sonneborni TaxID=65129 RepID=A0A8S1P3Q7_9CILI|nr:unnamed protein product [Paramecium sonneborni]
MQIELINSIYNNKDFKFIQIFYFKLIYYNQKVKVYIQLPRLLLKVLDFFILQRPLHTRLIAQIFQHTQINKQYRLRIELSIPITSDEIFSTFKFTRITFLMLRKQCLNVIFIKKLRNIQLTASCCKSQITIM